MSEGVLELLRVMFTIIWILAAGDGIPLIGHKLFKRCDISSVICEWKGTKKAYIWFAIWIALFVSGNAAVFILFAGDLWQGDLMAAWLFLIYYFTGKKNRYTYRFGPLRHVRGIGVVRLVRTAPVLYPASSRHILLCSGIVLCRRKRNGTIRRI